MAKPTILLTAVGAALLLSACGVRRAAEVAEVAEQAEGMPVWKAMQLT